MLEDKGVSWKVYTPSNVGVSGKFASLTKYLTWDPTYYDPTITANLLLTDNVLPYFRAFRSRARRLFKKAFRQTFPNDFAADVKSGKFPKRLLDHSAARVRRAPLCLPDERPVVRLDGARRADLEPEGLVQDGAVHHVRRERRLVRSRSAADRPEGQSGEYLTTNKFPAGEPHPETLGITGPLGLGVRVPLLVVSPFSRGGHIATEVFDHTSQLKLISERFGVEVPNVSAWRAQDRRRPHLDAVQVEADSSVPKLPKTSIVFAPSGPASYGSQWTESGGFGPSIPTKQRMPNQRGGSEPAGKFFKLDEQAKAIRDEDRTPIDVSGPPNETAKSRGNRLLSTEAPARR